MGANLIQCRSSLELSPFVAAIEPYMNLAQVQDKARYGVLGVHLCIEEGRFGPVI